MSSQFHASWMWMREIFNAKYGLFPCKVVFHEIYAKKITHFRSWRRKNLRPSENRLLHSSECQNVSRRFSCMQLFVRVRDAFLRSGNQPSRVSFCWIYFQLEIPRAHWIWKVSTCSLLKAWTFLSFRQSIFSSTFSRLVISFQDERFLPRQRTESKNLIDFLAESGGIFGLFLGASLLSFAELFYYLTLRMFFLRRQERRIERTSSMKPTYDFKV